METYRNGNKVLEIWQDSDAENPREYSDDITAFLTWERDNASPDENRHSTPQDFLLSLADAIHPDFSEWYLYGPDVPADVLNHHLWAILNKHYLILPVFAYSHGATIYSTGPFSCPWDSGQAGFIYVDRATIDKELSGDTERATEFLRAVVKEYSAWTSGDVWGYTVFEETVCDSCGSINRGIIDSCGGFIGHEWFRENLPEQFKELV